MLFLSADYTDGAIRIRVICEISVSVMALLFGVRIINRVMQASTLFTFHSLFCDEITHIDHVTQSQISLEATLRLNRLSVSS